jgi:glycosyltransferase involved in cell wall biosynthesis
MADHDLFLLPSQGESFGHVILEALLAGCPVLISDRTPWRGLQEKGIGWDLPLDPEDGFRAALQQCLAMDADEHRRWSQRAREYGLQHLRNDETIERTRALFRSALSSYET